MLTDTVPATGEPDLREPPPTPQAATSIPSRHEMNVLAEMANAASLAGMGTPQSVLTKMLLGRELGIHPMVAVQEIDLIPQANGSLRGSLNAKSQVALIRRRGIGDIRLVECDDQHAIVDAWRTDDGKHFPFKFDKADAERANLLRKDNYRKWPMSMFVARAIGLASKALFQDVFLGLAYTPDELGADTDEDGRPLLLDAPGASTGVKRKPSTTPAATATDVETTAQEVHTTIVRPPESTPETIDVVEEPPSEKPTTSSKVQAEVSPSPYIGDIQERAALQNQIKTLAYQLLKLSQTEWDHILAHWRVKGRSMTVGELQDFKRWLSSLHTLRWMRQEVQIPDDKWVKALEKRGAQLDIELSPAALEDLVDKLGATITPFKRTAAQDTLAQALGDVPHQPPVENFGGNA